jgi:hypothetical protein
MVTFSHNPHSGSSSVLYQFTFINHSNTEINYDIRNISGESTNYGNVDPGATAVSRFFYVSEGTLEYGNVAVVGIGLFGQPQLVTAPGVRFWSGYSGLVLEQYINLLAGNGWTVTQDSSSFNEITGNGFRVTLDGGGNQLIPANIFFQVYNA